jgi:aldehyde:ferredoxin oxidoreductase
MGLDVISTGQVIATAMEWWEKGLIGSQDTGGIQLEFGNADAMVEMVKCIASRQGFGDVLALGSYRAAEKLGSEAMKYVMHVKKMEMAADGVYASKGEAITHMTSERGADHLRPYASVVDAFGYIEPELGITEKAQPTEDGNKGWYKPLKELSMATNLLGVCLFASITLAVKPSTWAQALSAATGITWSKDDLLRAAERVINLERVFNAREGFTRKDDTIPQRFVTEPGRDGIGAGQVVNPDYLLDQYYDMMGWDKNTGWPTPEKLKSLNLEELIPILESLNRD